MSKILAIGCDLHQLSRVRKIVDRDGLNSSKVKRLSERILHPKNELVKFNELKGSINPQIAKTADFNRVIESCCNILSVSWCCKEAVFKTLDSKDQKVFSFKDWYKINDLNGRPFIYNDNYLKSNQNEEFLLTISHDNDLIISTVLRQLNLNNNK
ncbi:unnamed protein product [[Candida] boidinii]|uniref:Unnamed protein product n=1 Tax=Candida boidinii TaxID=5477 RepID=A0A9W6SUX5_CANBO|nr:hypothetical protein B5S30_g2248 [[Candida] boidinii]GME67491.1 unnamed protein product [[Candida] boidinii]GMG07703.1 unnamed protein product [[Candida] boidinii]